jgi:hypothetical protein
MSYCKTIAKKWKKYIYIIMKKQWKKENTIQKRWKNNGFHFVSRWSPRCITPGGWVEVLEPDLEGLSPLPDLEGLSTPYSIYIVFIIFSIFFNVFIIFCSLFFLCFSLVLISFSLFFSIFQYSFIIVRIVF